MRYPIEKYRIVVHQHPKYLTPEIIAMNTYAGEVVKGKAILHIDDVYDEEAGIKLAAARCAEKISRKRQARATRLLKKAHEQLELAQRYVDKMQHYYDDSCAEVEEAQAELHDIYHNM